MSSEGDRKACSPLLIFSYETKNKQKTKDNGIIIRWIFH